MNYEIINYIKQHGDDVYKNYNSHRENMQNAVEKDFKSKEQKIVGLILYLYDPVLYRKHLENISAFKQNFFNLQLGRGFIKTMFGEYFEEVIKKEREIKYE